MRTDDVTTPEGIARLIEHASAIGMSHIIELLRPVMAGRINMVVPTRETRMPPLHRLRKRPVAVLIGDDDYQPAGPATWACSAKLRDWARFAIIHGTGAQQEHYAMAALLTLETGRLLFIETSSSGAQDWAGFLRRRADLKFMGFLPTDGAHPVMPAKGAVH